jgi:UDP-glucuronate 4-epimerase
MKILVTGAAGFIGFHLTKFLLARGDEVVGIDNLNDYYDVSLKLGRLQQIEGNKNFTFEKMSVDKDSAINTLFKMHQFDVVVHLAAQAGVRYSIENPKVYIESNIVGFINILEACRMQDIGNLVYASSSSVYGANTQYPFSESMSIDHPVSLYAATKKSNELMAHSYAHLYGIPCTGLRFFTVYGPWGRPDMALFKFTKQIIEGSPIEIYNNGEMERDFTYISDIVQGVIQSIDNPAKPDMAWEGTDPNPATSYAPYRVYNIGNNAPVKLLDVIDSLEKALGKKAIRNYLPMQAGDVQKTWADTRLLQNIFGYKPVTTIEKGIPKFVEWYNNYYHSAVLSSV